MPDIEPSNAVLLTKIEALADVFNIYKDQNDKDHKSILEQTTKTNGTVKSLQKFRWMVIGMGIILTTLIVPIALSFLSGWVHSIFKS